jgi:ADP-ribose pyrophosphatase YjhB (NUDIX family)
MKPREVKFCHYCGVLTENKRIYGEVRPVCPTCEWVYMPDPKVAVILLVEKSGEVLLVQRDRTPELGKWSLPAGFVNAYEDPQDAAARECLEETGLQVEIVKLAAVLSGREHRNGADILMLYNATVTGGTLQAGDDAASARFFSRDALPPLAFNTNEQIIFEPHYWE